jgi:putative ABC transport system permease protein
MKSMFRELRYALRIIFKAPSLTVVAVVTLALGIGANSAVFSIVNAVLLRPLPYDHPERVMMLESAPLSLSPQFTATSLFDWRERAPSFESLAAFNPASGGVNLTGEAEPERVEAAEVTSVFFQTLGVQAFQGHTFTSENELEGNTRVVVLSYELWRRRFHGDGEIVGQTIRLNEVPHTVIGIAPPGVQSPTNPDLWLPLSFAKDRVLTGPVMMFNTIGRLKPDATVAEARAEMESFSQWLQQNSPQRSFSAQLIKVTPLHTQLVQKVRPALLILFGAVAFVLLIVCVNVTNLLLARASVRRKEMAIRAALGANRLQLARQMLIESSLLAVMGGAAGLLFALWSVDLLKAIGPADIPRLHEARLDVVVFGFTLGVSLLTGFLFGLAPALHASKVDLNEALKEGALAAPPGRWRFGLRNLLVVTEVALALVLLIGAGLLIKSFFRVLEVSPGFDARNVLTVALDLPYVKYPDAPQQTAFYQQLMERLGGLPGVQSVGATNTLPLATKGGVAFSFSIAGVAPSDMPQATFASYFIVTPDYLQTMGIPLLEGRGITEQDKQGAPLVALISQETARRYWPNESAIGKRIIPMTEKTPREIVGVVGDVKQWGLENSKSVPAIYIPHQQLSWPVTTIAIRTTGEPRGLASAVRGEVQALDKDLPVYDLKTMEQRLGESVAERRFTLILLATFAALALVLAAVGIYGVMSYAVTQRTREIGIRMALGAARRDVLWLIVGKGLTLTVVGVAIGLAAAYALTRLLAALLFGVSATDPTVFIAIAVVLTGVALGACFVPARRATRVDPMVALRYE